MPFAFSAMFRAPMLLKARLPPPRRYARLLLRRHVAADCHAYARYYIIRHVAHADTALRQMLPLSDAMLSPCCRDAFTRHAALPPAPLSTCHMLQLAYARATRVLRYALRRCLCFSAAIIAIRRCRCRC